MILQLGVLAAGPIAATLAGSAGAAGLGAVATQALGFGILSPLLSLLQTGTLQLAAQPRVRFPQITPGQIATTGRVLSRFRRQLPEQPLTFGLDPFTGGSFIGRAGSPLSETLLLESAVRREAQRVAARLPQRRISPPFSAAQIDRFQRLIASAPRFDPATGGFTTPSPTGGIIRPRVFARSRRGTRFLSSRTVL